MRQTDLENRLNTQKTRYEKVGNEWFFHTRERDVLGPYPSFEDAVEGVMVYISLMSLDDELKVA